MTAHASEHQVGRIKWCKSCSRYHMFPRYQAGLREYDDGIPAVRLLNILASMVVLWMVVIAWVLIEFGDDIRRVMGAA
ncbi:MAG: hypothetical protein LC798_21225 [Chloroflexi bacterium]|nr:hypothetical protein [Chloroflexota bacterium]